MKKRKISGIIAGIILMAVTVTFIYTGCYQDTNEARVTINLVRNDLTAKNEVRKKHMIDRILEFFSTRAEAGGWPSGHTGDLNLIVSSKSVKSNTFIIPAGSAKYNISIPAETDVTFRITHEATNAGWGTNDNWGGGTTVDVGPGEQNITITMKPMVFIESVTVSGASWGLIIQWYNSSIDSRVTSYNIYRSTDIDGPYTYLKNSTSYSTLDSTVVAGVRYYYRVSTNGTLGEGIMCDVVSGIHP